MDEMDGGGARRATGNCGVLLSWKGFIVRDYAI